MKNFRDLGGIMAADGRRVRNGLIFRSDNLFKITPADCSVLSGLVKEVIDLRTRLEMKEKPDVAIDGVENIPIPVFKESVIGITHETGSDYGHFIVHCHDKKAIRAIIPDMDKIYSYVMTDSDIVDKIGEAIRRIVDNALASRPTLFHCSEGKDRAGAVAALTLSLLGVGREEIFADYAATNRVVRRKAIINAILVTILKLDPVAGRLVYRSSIADPAYIRASFDVIDELYGSPEKFFRERIGISDELRERFRSAVLCKY